MTHRPVRAGAAPELRPGDIVLVEAGDIIPSDGEVIEGVASVNEAAITGESAPVIRESGGDRSAVTGGTQVLSDWIRVRITAAPGHTFLDRMIALVEGASRQKTPNEIALNILLAGMTLIFLFAVATIPSFAAYAGGSLSVLVLVALFVTLIPTTIGALLSAIGIAGHGPAGALQRARHVRPRGGGGRRCGHAAARQDRHDHAGQPPGDRIRPALRHRRARAGRCRPARLAVRRNPGRPLDRRAGEGKIRPARARHGAAARAFRAVHRAYAHERGGRGGPQHPQGRGRCRHRPCHRRLGRRAAGAGGDAARTARHRRPHQQRGRHAAGGRRRAAAARRSCTSRTSSRAASASGSPSCAAWASAR